MLNKIQHIAIYFLTFWVLFASTGITIYTHVCLSKNIQEASLFAIEKCVDKSIKEVASCCSKAKKSCSTEQISQFKNCCDYDSKYLVNDNTLFSQDFDLDNDFEFIALLELTPTLWAIPLHTPHKLHPQFLDLPPPKSGKQIIIELQRFLC